ncbi:9-O-acetylesterase [Opitutaceae bacterium TAV5]|nr:9-O-acetylesterase [Opitutaceae bacterium TAV5]
MKPGKSLSTLVACIALLHIALRADVTLSSIFSEHAVLQKRDRVPVWGKASPGEQITVSLGNGGNALVVAKATTGSDGKWCIQLDLSRASSGPFELVVTGNNTLRIGDIVVGEVWLASGQSNMAWTVYNCTDSRPLIAASANPHIRQFSVKRDTSPVPLDEVQGEWRIAGPRTTGGFTAVGYFFARELQKSLNQPVGLIHASWGGTNIEGWISPDGLARNSDLKTSADRYRDDEQTFSNRIEKYKTDFVAWSIRNQRMDTPVLSPADVFGPATGTGPTLAWTPVHLPLPSTTVTAASVTLPPAGTVWYRRTLEVPVANAGIQQALEIGRIDGFYTVYFNGEKIIEVTPATGARPPRPIYVNGQFVKAGANTLAVRIYNPGGIPVIRSGPPLRFIFRPIDGEWQMHVEKSFPLPVPESPGMPAFPIMPQKPQDIGGYIYNAMIHPLVPYAIRGAIWYQGESNASRAWQYRDAFPLLIADWRAQWKSDDFPFYFCQLANFGGKSDKAGDNAWAEIREAQNLALKLPATGQAVLIDIGEADDVHPRNKIDVGDRLARVALANTYGQKITFSGPVFASHQREGSCIRLTFTHADGGLVARELPATWQPRSTVERFVPLVRNSVGSQLEGFAICGADQEWAWAQAKIENDNRVVVWSPSVPAPVAVRYAWAMNPTCNLYNAAGLPASPFRTDDFPAITRNTKY